jgi:branched-chain amino acid transport system substrate-binding protein
MKTEKLLRRAVVVCFVLTWLASIGLVGFIGESEAQTLKVGNVWPLTGPGSDAFIKAKRGGEICRDWINAKGGVTVKGKKYLIDLITEDVKGTSEGCVAAATKLVHRDKVKFVVGVTTPVHVDAVASVTEPNKVFYFASIHDTLSPDYPYTASAYISYSAPKLVTYDYLQKTYPNVKRVALTELDEASVHRAADAARAEMKKRGLQDVGGEVYPMGTRDFYPILNKVLAKKPDALDINMEFPSNAGTIVRQARELGFTGPIIANSPWDPNFVMHAIGKSEYATDVLIPNFDTTTAMAQLPEITKMIIKLWTDIYKVPFETTALRGWDPLHCLVQAIEAAQSFDPGDVMRALEKMQTIECSSGTAKIGGLKTYGVNHMVVQRVPLTRIKNGQLEFVGWKSIDIL